MLGLGGARFILTMSCVVVPESLGSCSTTVLVCDSTRDGSHGNGRAGAGRPIAHCTTATRARQLKARRLNGDTPIPSNPVGRRPALSARQPCVCVSGLDVLYWRGSFHAPRCRSVHAGAAGVRVRRCRWPGWLLLFAYSYPASWSIFRAPVIHDVRAGKARQRFVFAFGFSPAALPWWLDLFMSPQRNATARVA